MSLEAPLRTNCFHSPRLAMRSVMLCFIGAAAWLGLQVLLAQEIAQTAQSVGIVRHAPSISGRVEGSIQQLAGENALLGSGAAITKDLLVPGTPRLLINGSPIFGGTIQ